MNHQASRSAYRGRDSKRQRRLMMPLMISMNKEKRKPILPEPEYYIRTLPQFDWFLLNKKEQVTISIISVISVLIIALIISIYYPEILLILLLIPIVVTIILVIMMLKQEFP